MATTPVFLPGKYHGQRSLEAYSPWSCRVRHNLATKQQEETTLLSTRNTILSTLNKLVIPALSLVSNTSPEISLSLFFF